MSGCALRQERERPGESDLRCEHCSIALRRAETGYLCAVSAEVPDYPADGNELFFQLEEKSFWFQHRNRVLLTLIERFAPAGPIWDIGGGNGYQALTFERAGVRSVLVEPGPRGCANARARGVPVVLCARLEDVGLREGQIGAASFLDVIEHLEEPRPLLEEAHRALAPGGRVYVTVPAHQALWSDADDYAEHKTRYTARGLRALFEQTGFRVEYLSYYFGALVLPILAARVIPSRLRRLRGVETKETGADEHREGGLAVRVIERLLAREAAQIADGVQLGWGASIVLVARR